MKYLRYVFLFLLISLSFFVSGCATTPNSIRGELGVPNPDLQRLTQANRAALQSPHNVRVLLNFGDQLYATGRFYEAYDRWLHASKIAPENRQVQERIDRGIVKVLFVPAEFGDNEDEFRRKWNDQAFKTAKRIEIANKWVDEVRQKTHLPEEVIRGRMIVEKWDCVKMTIREGGVDYSGYVYVMAKKIPFFPQRELFRVFEVDENIARNNFYEAAKAVIVIERNFPHAKDEATKMRNDIKEKWYSSLREVENFTFEHYEANKNAYYSFLEIYAETQEATDLKAFMDDMLANYFRQLSITSLESAILYYNDVQRYAQIFRNSRHRSNILLDIERKWSHYLRSNAPAIVSDPQRAKNELFAFRNAFITSNPQLVQQVEQQLETTLRARYAALEVIDTTDVRIMHEALQHYRDIFGTTSGYHELASGFEKKYEEFIKSFNISTGSQFVAVNELFEHYKKMLPSASNIRAIDAYMAEHRQRLDEEAARWIEMAETARRENKLTLAARHVERALDFSPNNARALVMREEMSEFMSAITELNESLTMANDAPSFAEATRILDAYIGKFPKFGELTKEAVSEKNRLSRWRNNWQNRQKSVFSTPR